MLYKQRFWQLCKCAAEISVLQCMNGSILHKLGATKLRFNGDNLLGELFIYYMLLLTYIIIQQECFSLV